MGTAHGHALGRRRELEQVEQQPRRLRLEVLGDASHELEGTRADAGQCTL